jgi:aspartyl-tRNA synthetase
VIRTQDAGRLTTQDIGRVTLTGWVAKRRDHGGVAFIDLRDASGVVPGRRARRGPDRGRHDLRNEYCIKVTGEVDARTAEQRQPRPADRRDRGRRRDASRCSTRARRCPSRSTSGSPSARRRG